MRQIDIPQVGQCILFNSRETNNDSLSEMLSVFMGNDSKTLAPDDYIERLLLFIEIVFPSDSGVQLTPGTSYF